MSIPLITEMTMATYEGEYTRGGTNETFSTRIKQAARNTRARYAFFAQRHPTTAGAVEGAAASAVVYAAAVGVYAVAMSAVKLVKEVA